MVEMIQVLEGPIALTTCNESHTEPCELEEWCPVKINWQMIHREVHRALAAISLAEMAQPTIPILPRIRSHAANSPE